MFWVREVGEMAKQSEPGFLTTGPLTACTAHTIVLIPGGTIIDSSITQTDFFLIEVYLLCSVICYRCMIQSFTVFKGYPPFRVIIKY